MNNSISAAERVRRSRWAGQVEATANKLHQLLLEAPIPMPREPVIHMDLIDGLIELSGYDGDPSGGNESESKVTFQAREKNQRDWMREVAQELGFDREACVQRYAELDEQGVAPRKRRTMPSEDYATALWQDGVKKGWLSQGNEKQQRKLRVELSEKAGKQAVKFSWQLTADQTLEQIKRLADSG